MRYVKTYESFDNWSFLEWASDALTEVFDDYEHSVNDKAICIFNDSEPVYREVQKKLEFLKNKYEFTIYQYGGYMIIIEIKPEYIKSINSLIDSCEVDDSDKSQIYYEIVKNGRINMPSKRTILFALSNPKKTFYINKIFFDNEFSKDFRIQDYDELSAIYLYVLEKYFNVSGYEINNARYL